MEAQPVEAQPVEAQPVEAQPVEAQPVEALWYSRNGAASTTDFLAHSSRISIVSPQVFAFDSLGDIHGALDTVVVRAARARGVQLVPLVMNPGFDQALMHRVLTVASARARAMRSLAALCRDQHLDGIQFDIENVHVTDRDVFTSFVREAVDSIHRAGCAVSAAVVPRTGDDPGPTAYHRWIYDNWRGVYDYKALADTCDFLSYMTYAQHTGGSPAGPVGGYPWIKASLQYVLSLGVPAHKISLGIPGYSDHWFPAWDWRYGSRQSGSDISYADGQQLLKKFGATARWDAVQKSPVAMWENAGVFEHLWLEDVRAFQEKLALVTQYKLRGYSVWLLGLEDPRVWSLSHSVSKVPVRK
jgi:spore germination protein YaaH